MLNCCLSLELGLFGAFCHTHLVFKGIPLSHLYLRFRLITLLISFNFSIFFSCKLLVKLFFRVELKFCLQKEKNKWRKFKLFRSINSFSQFWLIFHKSLIRKRTCTSFGAMESFLLNFKIELIFLFKTSVCLVSWNSLAF